MTIGLDLLELGYGLAVGKTYSEMNIQPDSRSENPDHKNFSTMLKSVTHTHTHKKKRYETSMHACKM